ncbi:MAG: ATP-binding cassette domain-containing protein [Acidobacteriota bacterium]|nr:ATP-binding cassette domain-containing protein [Acidobacteriota bacterium]
MHSHSCGFSSDPHNDSGRFPVLAIHSLSKRYGTRQVLSEIAMSIHAHEVLALCGPSGSGKTTLIRIISGLTGFDGGRLQIADSIVAADAPYPGNLFGKVGVVFQEPNLFPHLTAIENVMLALREFKRLPANQAHERAMVELERMKLASLARRYPASLSGGEKQRLAIARALAVDPLLLLLDEPTANLDPDLVDEVCDRILELAGAGMTMLLVTHNVDFARQAAGSFALLQDGRCRCSRDGALLENLRSRRK